MTSSRLALYVWFRITTVSYSSLTAAAAVVAVQLGVGMDSVRRWALQAEIDGGRRPRADQREELAEIKALKVQNRRLHEDVEILRGATTFFVGELDPRNRCSWDSSTP